MPYCTIVEVWRSGADARAFAELTAPMPNQMPAPSRVVGCEAAHYETA